MQFSDVTNLFSKALIAGGGLGLVFSLIQLAGGVKDHEGTKIQSAIWGAVASGITLLAAGMVSSITL